MPGLTQLIAMLAAFLVLIHANPSDNGPCYFTVIQVVNPKHIRRSPEYLYARALSKYGQDHSALVARDMLQLNGSVIATPEKDDESFLSPITIGNQTMLVNIDTGSADFWVFSSLLPEDQRKGHVYYTPGPDATKLDNYNWSVTYGDGTFAQGEVFLDNVTLGGVSVHSQAVEAAT
ncbi:hypothetical protein PRK78_001963 [Emydomyces testavorans]|uniref:Peptidase A1 domain-containing protein n=1 Tax=Emydomyces testavorans TaxID=2070801 RepID=A0AAF0IH62_9EURO|nr:hypothetical protein PRK78_001963 [Emydomyces testavorans]